MAYKRKRGETTAPKSKAKPPPKPRRGNVRQFWKPIVDEKLLNFCPYGNTEMSVRKVFDFCRDFIEKMENGYNSTLYGRIDNLITKWLFNRITATHEREMDIINELIKLSRAEIKEVSSVLKEIHTIQEKSCSDVIADVARKNCVSNSDFYKLFLELSPLIPVWMGSINETAPRLVGAIPAEDDSLLKPGQYVAAYVLPGSVNPNSDEYSGVNPDDDSNEDAVDIPPPNEEFGIIGSWILARVLVKTGKSRRYKNNKNALYTVVDMDNIAYPHYLVERKVVIPLPLYRADPKTNPEAIFPVGTVVLALYLNTTCFYPAVVLDTPKTLNDTYTICCRDVNNKLQYGPVIRAPQRYVIKYVEPLSLFTECQRRVLNEVLSFKYSDTTAKPHFSKNYS
ncbi:SAGA-associated factor 29 [Parasteatoda tepidariorum]|uniref:SAGA-associated factor 29 n=1 Tax=Parasteatoda tepidariorum TaxID=114398 RepID=UPI001C72698E|nr:SAGA-associated factor 29 [Parasteatoda tepidariorum]